MIGEFSMANEPSLNIPYIYDRLGAPWKTQKRVRAILDAYFRDDLQGFQAMRMRRVKRVRCLLHDGDLSGDARGTSV